jgi:hypothetical protein
MEWPPEFILARLRHLAGVKLQPSELLAILRELALQHKAFLADNAGDETTNFRKRVGALTRAPNHLYGCRNHAPSTPAMEHVPAVRQLLTK